MINGLRLMVDRKLFLMYNLNKLYEVWTRYTCVPNLKVNNIESYLVALR